jgi:hypothetical protein
VYQLGGGGVAKQFRELTVKLVVYVRPFARVNNAATARWGFMKFRIWDCYKNVWNLSEFNPLKVTFRLIPVYVYDSLP